MIINVFLLANELFTAFYNSNREEISWRYLRVRPAAASMRSCPGSGPPSR